MYLSILIPTHNYICVSLCEEMSRQIDACRIDAEIIVLDDASDDEAVRIENRKIRSLKYCRLIELDENVGIARARNMLGAEANGEFLLYMDSDVFPVSSDFLKTYIGSQCCDAVICGGLTFRLNGPVAVSPLRYAYGMNYEAKQTHFISLNFFVSAELFRKIEFDESFSKYGHEDTQFGAQLQSKGYKIVKIENPVFHDNGDTSEQFLRKTRTAIDNLVEHREKLQNTSRLLCLYARLQPLHIGWLLSLPFKWGRGAMERNLLGSKPSLTIYNIYKLSYLCSKM